MHATTRHHSSSKLEWNGENGLENGDVGSIEMVSGRRRRRRAGFVFSCKERRGRLKWRESGRGCATRPTEGKDGSTIHPQWLQSQEQKLLRARSVAVIRMLMRIDRGHLATRGQTREFRGVARAESFLRHGVCTRRARVSAPR